MQDSVRAADIDSSRSEPFQSQNLRELARAFGIRALGDSDEEMTVRLTDISSVDGTGRGNLMNARIEVRQHRADVRDFSGATRCTWTRQHCTTLSQNRCVLDEGRIRVCGIRRQTRQRQSTLLQRRAITPMLIERLGKVGLAESRRGETLCERCR